jgi:hypothetical protein
MNRRAFLAALLLATNADAQELRTLSQWNVPSTQGMKPYKTDRDRPLRSVRREFYRVGGSIVVYMFHGDALYVSVCASSEQLYLSRFGNDKFERLDPDGIFCDRKSFGENGP